MRIKRSIVHIAHEVAPYYKNGGLGDVVSSLPHYLSKKYKNVIISFYYKGLMNFFDNYITDDFFIEMQGVDYKFNYYYLSKNDVDYFFLNLEDEQVFCTYSHNALNGKNAYKNFSSIAVFLYFGKAALKLIQLKVSNLAFIICHDWHAAGIFAYPSLTHILKMQSQIDFRTILLIHHYGHQGNIYEDIYPFLEDEPLELIKDLYLNYGSATLLGLAIEHADYLLTVSENYAKELKNGKLPHENLKYILQNKKNIIGMPNGADYSEWHPENSPFLTTNYNVNSKENKLIFKNEIFQKYGFDIQNIEETPLVLYMCRLTIQKGINLFYDSYDSKQEAATDFFNKYLKLGLKFIIYGEPSGGIKGNIHKSLTLISQKYPESFYYNPNYDDENAHIFLAASDIVLMPSLFEPCGLVQLYAMAFGAVPIVNQVGGLKDTVNNYYEKQRLPTGFYMENCNRKGLYDTTKKVVEIYKNHPDKWEQIQINAMKQDFSWNKNIQNYFDFFEEIEKNVQFEWHVDKLVNKYCS